MTTRVGSLMRVASKVDGEIDEDTDSEYVQRHKH